MPINDIFYMYETSGGIVGEGCRGGGTKGRLTAYYSTWIISPS